LGFEVSKIELRSCCQKFSGERILDFLFCLVCEVAIGNQAPISDADGCSDVQEFSFGQGSAQTGVPKFCELSVPERRINHERAIDCKNLLRHSSKQAVSA